ncbi:MAG: hypothetical protein M4D80_08580 [Myxococcota bacterium]|nr:hypothetical protein [Deltaproteobacteria bacterium]MDQ3335204.1 hypothetical protein [Myxococcota bacterium]
MLSRITLLSLLLSSGVALAQRAPAPAASKAPSAPAVNLPPINLDEVPEQCKTTAKQAGAISVQAALSARISLANCIADAKLVALTLLDCEDSVLAVDEAAKMSRELLDGVIAGAIDDSTKIVAEMAKAELYNQMTVRMMKTLPAHDGTESSIAMHNVRKSLLEGLLVKWKDAAAVSFENILAIVKAKPALEKNPVVASAMRTAKDRLRLHVASAKPAPAPAADDKAPTTDTGEQLR